MTAAPRTTLRKLHRQTAVPEFVKDTVRGPGQSLDEPLQSEMAPRFGYDLSRVRVHTGPKAATSARLFGARAYTYGQHIVFGAGQYAPGTPEGQKLLAHEIAHTVQQRNGGSAPGTQHEHEADRAAEAVSAGAAQTSVSTGSSVGVACAMDDWLNSTPNVRGMSYSEIVSDIDEINQWLSRQMQSTPESARLEEALVELQAEKRRKEKRAFARKRKRKKKKKQQAQTPRSELERPRVLIERTSVNYEDSAEIHQQVDLIMEWLARNDLTSDERSILKGELDVLAPKFNQERQKAEAQRRSARLHRVFNPQSDENFNALEHFARVVQGIVPDNSRPGVFLILHKGEQIAISGDQVKSLQANVAGHFKKGRSRALQRARDGFNRYRSQVEINDESPIISSIAGFLGDAGDPIMAMTIRNSQAQVLLNVIAQQIKANDYPAAAVTLAKVERLANEIHAAGVAFSENHIKGAGIAVKTLEITRDVSFAIAGSIAAIVAAPVVATAVAGTGATGAVAFGATTVGTGLTVGTGTAVVRGGSAFTGELAAGNSLDRALEAGGKEAKRGAKEGIVTGVTGGAAQGLSKAFGATKAGLSLAQQTGRRAAAEGVADFIGGATGEALEGKGFTDIVKGGAVNSVLGLPGNLAGAGVKNPALRAVTENTVGAASAAGGTYLMGGSTEDVIQTAATSVVAGTVIRRAGASKGGSRKQIDSGEQQKRLTAGDEDAVSAKRTADEEALELDHSRSYKKGAEQPVAHNEIDLGPTPKGDLELDLGPTKTREVKHNEIDLGPAPKESLELATTKRRGVSPDVEDAAGAMATKIDQEGLDLSLHVGKNRLKKIQSGEKDFMLSQRATFDIDEPLPVGQKGIKRQRAVGRALSARNRQLLDAPTNRRTKGLGIDPRDLTRTPKEPVSVTSQPDALITRRFDEVTELNTIFNQAVDSVDYRSIKKPTAIKNKINKKVRDIITNGQTPEAIAVRDALRSLGFERLPRIGWVLER